MCQILRVSRNAYYHWRRQGGQVSVQRTETLALQTAIKRAFTESHETYGSYRIHQVLKRQGYDYSRSYIALQMKVLGLKSVVRRKYVVTTASEHQHPVAENVLDRSFTTTRLGHKWVSDITYVRVGQQWNYLTVILDLADRKVVGWALSQDMTVPHTTFAAWTKARQTRHIQQDLIFHSDRGVQYASGRLNAVLTHNQNIKQSMSRKGNCWDNAVAESFFKTIKAEWINRQYYTSSQQAFDSIQQYIKWYNHKRLHSSLGYLTPLEKQHELTKHLF